MKESDYMNRNDKDYTCLIDIAKLNLSKKLNIKTKQYQETPNNNLKNEMIELLKDRQQLFLFNTSVIEKYL